MLDLFEDENLDLWARILQNIPRAESALLDVLRHDKGNTIGIVLRHPELAASSLSKRLGRRGFAWELRAAFDDRRV